MKQFNLIALALVLLALGHWLTLESPNPNPPPSGATMVQQAQQLLKIDTNPLPDFRQFTDVKAKKQAFFDYLHPIIRANNQHLLAQRDRLLALKQHGLEDLDADDRAFLQTMIERYEVDPEQIPSRQLDVLLNRVDIVPVSLALTQAAMESAWGTSRFAREGNNLFGQWCYRKGCGMVPGQRGSNQTHEVARFVSADRSVASYMRNINSHRAYADLRSHRAALRRQGQPITGHDMAGHLLRYSERGEAYIQELRSMMRVNRLAPLDLAAAD